MLTPSTFPGEIDRIRTLVVSEQPLVQAELLKFLGLLPDISLVGERADGSSPNELVRKLQPDVLVLDGTSSRRESLATLTALKAASTQLPIVFLALQDSKTYILQAFSAGAAGYVVSMSGELYIANAIREVHAGHQYLCPRIRGKFLCFAHRPLPTTATAAQSEGTEMRSSCCLNKGKIVKLNPTRLSDTSLE